MEQEVGAVLDRGPWRAHIDQGGLVLQSDDSRYDVQLCVSGDFGGAAARQAYGDYLATLLTAGCVQRAAAQLEDEGQLLAQLQQAMAGPQGELMGQVAAELSRLRLALAEAEQALAEGQVTSYARRQAALAQEPSALALALQQALGR